MTMPARCRSIWCQRPGFRGGARWWICASATGRLRSGSPATPASWRWCPAGTDGLPDSLPPGTYRLAAVPEGADASRMALGWALATYSFDLYRQKKKEAAARLVWPKEADRGLVERLAGAVCLARDLINTPASDLGPAELAEAATQVANNMGARHRVIVGDALLAEN